MIVSAQLTASATLDLLLSFCTFCPFLFSFSQTVGQCIHMPVCIRPFIPLLICLIFMYFPLRLFLDLSPSLPFPISLACCFLDLAFSLGFQLFYISCNSLQVMPFYFPVTVALLRMFLFKNVNSVHLAEGVQPRGVIAPAAICSGIVRVQYKLKALSCLLVYLDTM